MLIIHSRNIDDMRVKHEFSSPEVSMEDCNSEDPSMGDNKILLVILDGLVLYSSLGGKAKTYDDTLRTSDLYEWFEE